MQYLLKYSCFPNEIKTTIPVPTDSSHQRAGGNLRYYEKLLSSQLNEVKQAPEPTAEEPIQLGTYSRPKDHLPEREAYEALCRGEGVQMVKTKQWDANRTHVAHFRLQLTTNSSLYQCKHFCTCYSETFYSIIDILSEDLQQKGKCLNYVHIHTNTQTYV